MSKKVECHIVVQQTELPVTRKIVFRCDGAELPEVGTGHVVRDILIADAFVERKICLPGEISFVMRVHGPFSIGYHLVMDSGYRVESSSDGHLEWNSEEEIRVLTNLNPEVLVIDRLSTESNWMAALASNLRCIVSMDDVGEGSFLADLAINSIFHDIPANGKRYTGYDYLFLKKMTQLPIRNTPKSVSLVVASFGGYDHRDLMGFFLKMLQKSKFDIKAGLVIELLVGTETKEVINRWKVMARQVSCENNIGVRLLVRPPDFIERLAKADLAVLSGGLTIFDAVSLGVPAIGLPQYEHQLNTLRNLQRVGVVRLGSNGMHLEKVNFKSVFDRMMRSNRERVAQREIGPTLIDRKGSDRVINILSALLR